MEALSALPDHFSPATGEFHSQRASYADLDVSLTWVHIRLLNKQSYGQLFQTTWLHRNTNWQHFRSCNGLLSNGINPPSRTGDKPLAELWGPSSTTLCCVTGSKSNNIRLNVMKSWNWGDEKFCKNESWNYTKMKRLFGTVQDPRTKS